MLGGESLELFYQRLIQFIQNVTKPLYQLLTMIYWVEVPFTAVTSGLYYKSFMTITTVASTIKLQSQLRLALAMIINYDSKYAPNWSVIYNCKFMILKLL